MAIMRFSYRVHTTEPYHSLSMAVFIRIQITCIDISHIEQCIYAAIVERNDIITFRNVYTLYAKYLNYLRLYLPKNKSVVRSNTLQLTRWSLPLTTRM